MLLHQLDVSLAFHFVYFTVFGVSFLQAGRLHFLLILESASPGWGWTNAMPCASFLVCGICACVLVDGARSCVLWRAVLCPVVCFGVSIGFVWLWAACLLMCKVVLFCWRIGVGHSALELASFWVGHCLSVERRLLGGFSPINVLWGQELFSGPKTCSWLFLLCGSSPTPYCSIKISQDTQQKTK